MIRGGEKAPSFVPRYVDVAETSDGWAKSPADLVHQLKTVRWHKGSPTAIALRLAALVGSRDRLDTFVPLQELKSVHEITPGDAQLEARRDALAQFRDDAPNSDRLSMALQQRYLNSKNAIRVVEDREGQTFVIDGNLRVKALRQSLPPEIKIEVERLKTSSRIVSWLVHRLVRVRGV